VLRVSLASRFLRNVHLQPRILVTKTPIRNEATDHNDPSRTNLISWILCLTYRLGVLCGGEEPPNQPLKADPHRVMDRRQISAYIATLVDGRQKSVILSIT
jgi:hypothetical protein